MGHATRSSVLIRRLSLDNKVTIGVTDLTKPYFQNCFPNHQLLDLPAYNIRYSRILPVWLIVLLQTFRIKKVIKQEHDLLRKFLSIKCFDVIISDNRFGLHNKACHSIIVTHQLTIQSPVFKRLANHINARMLNQFDEVWVPDFEDTSSRLSGVLSQPVYLNTVPKYIGPLSHLTITGNTKHQDDIDCLAIISGPEPQSTVFEIALKKSLHQCNLNVVIVGCRKTVSANKPDTSKYYGRVEAEELVSFINRSKLIICRSGYSTLMDLSALGKTNLITVPTPGQTEQEYLATYWQQKFGADVLQQKRLEKDLPLLIKTRLHLEQ